MFKLVFGGPWYIKVVLGILLIGFAAFMVSTDIDREREKAAALEAGVPAMVALDQFRRDADIHSANEVHVTGYSVPDYEYELTETRSPRRGPDYDVVRHMFVMFGAGDPGGSKAARAVAIMAPERADRFADEMLEHAVDYTDAGIVFRVNGTTSAAPELSSIAEEALADAGLTKAANFVFIEPWVGTREAALAPTELSARAGVPGSIAAAGLVLLILGFRGWRSRPLAAASPETVPAPVPEAQSVPAPTTRKRSMSLAIGLIAIAAVLGVLAWKPALASSLLGYLAVAVILFIALRIAGIFPGRKKQADEPAEDVSVDSVSAPEPSDPPSPQEEETVASVAAEPQAAPVPRVDGAAGLAASGLDWTSAPPAPGGAGSMNGSSHGLPKSELDWSQAPGTSIDVDEPEHVPADVRALHGETDEAQEPAPYDASGSQSLSEWRQAKRPALNDAQPTYFARRPETGEGWFEPDSTETPDEDGAAEEDTALEKAAAPVEEDTTSVAGGPGDDDRHPDVSQVGAPGDEPLAVSAEPQARDDDQEADTDSAPSEIAGAKSGAADDGTDLFLRNLVAKMHEAGPGEPAPQVAADDAGTQGPHAEASETGDEVAAESAPESRTETTPVEDTALAALLAEQEEPGLDEPHDAEPSDDALATMAEAERDASPDEDRNDALNDGEGGEPPSGDEEVREAGPENSDTRDREPDGRTTQEPILAQHADPSGEADPDMEEAASGGGGGDAGDLGLRGADRGAAEPDPRAEDDLAEPCDEEEPLTARERVDPLADHVEEMGDAGGGDPGAALSPEEGESASDDQTGPKQAVANTGDGGGVDLPADMDADAAARAEGSPREARASGTVRFDENGGEQSPIGAGLPKRAARSVPERNDDEVPDMADPSPFTMAHVETPRPSITVAEMLARRRERLKAERSADT